jgi:hypothetical protein
MPRSAAQHSRGSVRVSRWTFDADVMVCVALFQISLRLELENIVKACRATVDRPLVIKIMVCLRAMTVRQSYRLVWIDPEPAISVRIEIHDTTFYLTVIVNLVSEELHKLAFCAIV